MMFLTSIVLALAATVTTNAAQASQNRNLVRAMNEVARASSHHHTRAEMASSMRMARHVKRGELETGTRIGAGRRSTASRASERRIMGKRMEMATVKCITETTWELCGDSVCTPMGSVAAGTICRNNAMTTADGVSHATVAETSATKSETPAPAVTETPAPSASVPAAEVRPVLAAVPKPSSASTDDHSSSTDSHDTETDNESCDAEGSSEPAESTASVKPVEPAYTQRLAVVAAAVVPSPSPPPPSPSLSSSSEAVKSTEAPKVEPTPSPSPSPSPSTTATHTPSPTPAPAPVPAPAPSSPAPSTGETFTGGKATFYNQEGAVGACGKSFTDSDFIVAIQTTRFGNGANPNNAPDCGRRVRIVNAANGKSTEATVADRCPSCQGNPNSLDLSVAAFNAIADPALGVIGISWSFTS